MDLEFIKNGKMKEYRNNNSIVKTISENINNDEYNIKNLRRLANVLQQLQLRLVDNDVDTSLFEDDIEETKETLRDLANQLQNRMIK